MMVFFVQYKHIRIITVFYGKLLDSASVFLEALSKSVCVYVHTSTLMHAASIFEQQYYF